MAVWVYPGSGADDGNVRGLVAGWGGANYLVNSASYIYVGKQVVWYWGDFMRFVNVPIPQGSVISYAELRFTSDGDYANANTKVIMAGNAADDAVAPTTYEEWNALNITSETLELTFGPWGNSETQQIDVTDIIQEIINRPGWSTNNALMLMTICAPDGTTACRHYADESPLQGALIVITFDEESSSSSSSPSSSISTSSASSLSSSSSTGILEFPRTKSVSSVGPSSSSIGILEFPWTKSVSSVGPSSISVSKPV